MLRSLQLPTVKSTRRIICSKTHRIPRGKSRRTNGSDRIRASRRPIPLRGRAITNSGRLLRGSTTSTAIGICSVPVRQSKNSATSNRRFERRRLTFGREFGRGDGARRDKTQGTAVCFFSGGGAGFVIFRVLIHLPEIVELGVGQNVLDA